MKKLLVFGGGHSDIPIILAGKKLGYYVITSGNNPDELGHKHSNQYINCDYSDKRAMLRLAKKLDVDAISPCANDFSAIACSYVSEKLNIGNFDTYNTSQIIHHKDKYRAFAKKNGIRTPHAKSFKSIEAALSKIESFTFPVIIKPVDLSGGKGIAKINRFNEPEIKKKLTSALKASKSGKIVIEEFIEGSHHGLSLIIKDKKVIFSFCDDEHYYKNKYLVSGASTPSSAPKKAIDKVIYEAEKISSILDLKNGILHLQFIVKEETPYIIEICRRPPGDLYVDFVTYATGLNYAEAILNCFIGNPIEVKQNSIIKNYTRHCIMAAANGTVSGIFIDKQIEGNIKEQLIWHKKGDQIEDFMSYKAGIIFLEFKSRKEMQEVNKNLIKLIKIKTSDILRI